MLSTSYKNNITEEDKQIPSNIFPSANVNTINTIKKVKSLLFKAS